MSTPHRSLVLLVLAIAATPSCQTFLEDPNPPTFDDSDDATGDAAKADRIPPPPEASAVTGPPRVTRNAFSTAQLLRLFRDATETSARAAALVNARPTYRIEASTLVITREAWELSWPTDLAATSRYSIADRLGFAIEKRFDSETAGVTYATRGIRRGIGETDNTIAATTYSGKGCDDAPCAAIALRYPADSASAGFTDYLRFIASARSSALPNEVVGIVESGGDIQAAFLMSRVTREIRVPLEDPRLPNLSTQDLRNAWNDATVSFAPPASAYLGRSRGFPLIDDATLSEVLQFTHNVWTDRSLGTVGTHRWPAFLIWDGMLVSQTGSSLGLKFFPKGFTEELRGLRGAPNYLIGRFQFLLKDANGNPNAAANQVLRFLIERAATVLDFLASGHYVRKDAEGNQFIDGYYVLAKESPRVSSFEKLVFERARGKLTRP